MVEENELDGSLPALSAFCVWASGSMGRSDFVPEEARRVSLGAGKRRPPRVAPSSDGSQAAFPCACEGKDFALEAEDPDWGSHGAVCRLCGL